MALANVNGEVLPLTEVRISVLDRGFLFGDAVYEVMRVYGGKPYLVEEHFDRLERSLEAIRLHGVDLVRFRRRMEETLRQSEVEEGLVYIQITRGSAPRRHAFPDRVEPLELLWAQPFGDAYKEKRSQGAAVITMPDIRWQRCDVKSTNLLGNVLASQAAAEAGCLEAIFYRPDGTLTEGSHTNLFGVRDGAIVTAPRSNAILPGITRTLIVRLAQQADIPVVEDYLRRDELGHVSELFISGTTAEVMPVIQVDDIPIGTGEPGAITRRLQQAYQKAVDAFVGSVTAKS